MKLPADCVAIENVRQAADTLNQNIVTLLGQRLPYISHSPIINGGVGYVDQGTHWGTHWGVQPSEQSISIKHSESGNKGTR